MSALKRIRENVGLVIILIAISLAAFILTDLFTGLGGVQIDNTAAEIAGEDVEYNVFSNRAQVYRQNTRNNPDITDAQINQQVWQDIIRERVTGREYENVGMVMSDEETRMLFYGPIYSRQLIENPIFRDTVTQTFSPIVLQNYINATEQLAMLDQVTQAQADQYNYFLQLRRDVQTERMQAKWQSLVASAQMVSDLEAQKAYARSSRGVTFSYVSVPYATVAAEQSTPTEEDYKAFYEENKERYRISQPLTRVKYVYFPLTPSVKDRSDLRVEMENNYKKRFAAQKNAFSFAASSSNVYTVQQDTSYRPLSEIPEALQTVDVGTVVGPVETDYGFALYRLVGAQEDSFYTVKARHILITPTAATPGQPVTDNDSLKAKSEAESIRMQVLNDRLQFGQLASENSDDQFTAGKAGMLGWINPSTYGEEFGKIVGDANEGNVVIATSPRGYHVVEILERTNKTYAYAELARRITVSSATRDSVYKRAGQYASQIRAGANMDSTLVNFNEAATNRSTFVSPDVYQLQGNELENPREMLSWSFQAEEGDLSPKIFDSGNAFVVARVTDKADGEFLPLSAVRDDIQTEVLNRKRSQNVLNNLGGGSDLQQIAAAYGPSATTGRVENVTLASSTAGDLGAEPKVIGTAHGLSEGQISNPIEGNNGVYIIKVESINDPGEISAELLTVQKQQISQQKQQTAVRASDNALRDLADIKDYRFRFDYQAGSGR